MIARFKVAISLVGLLLVMAVVDPVAHAASCDIAELYVRSISMNVHVDSVRHVTRAVMTNNARGEFMLDFTARRTDLTDTRERWTVTHFTDSQGQYSQTLEVDGVRRHTIIYTDAATTPQITISGVSLTAEVNVLQPCLDSDLPVFKALAVQTGADRSIVAQVTTLVRDAIDTDPPPPTFDECWQMCPPVPTWCQDLDPEVDCVFVHACCVLTCQYSKCVAQCWCEFGPNPDPPEDCCANQEAIYLGCLNSCLESLVECLEANDCN